MENKIDSSGKIEQDTTETDTKSLDMTEACSAIKEDIQCNAQQNLVGRIEVGKPRSLADSCAEMKEEIKEEAERLFPDRGHHEHSGV